MIFERFRQLEESPTRTYGGLGLGLAICKTIVDLHGGVIEARSEGLGRGATFRVWLPSTFARAQRVRGERPGERAGQTRGELHGVRVLVVDDDEDGAEFVTAVLEGCGAAVTTASTVADAFARIRETTPDVVLTDIAMPDADGYTFIAQLRALPREQGGTVAAASLTGYASAEDRRRSLEAGFDMHLTKPIDVDELVTMTSTLARMGRSLRARQDEASR